jgi:hypothetical protein
MVAEATTNGAGLHDLVKLGDPPTSYEPPPPAPRRVCFGLVKNVSTPFQSMLIPEALCGQALREKIDNFTFDKGAVTCAECKKKLTAPAQPHLAAAVAQAPGGSTLSPAPASSALRSVTEIQDELAELEGRRAYLKVLLKAARAREKAMAAVKTESVKSEG